MSISIRFVCGHASSVGLTSPSDPICPACGEARIARTSAPPPRFTGTCRGPYAETKILPPAIVSVAPKGPLSLKAQE